MSAFFWLMQSSLLSAFLFTATNCAATAGVAIGPTVDTRGGFGVEAQVRGGFGSVLSSPGLSIPITARLGSGSMDPVQQPYFVFGLDVPFLLFPGADNHVALRVGAGYVGRKIFDGPTLNGPSVFFGISRDVLDRFNRGGHGGLSSGYKLLLGGELRFDYLFGTGLDRGVISLPLTFDWGSWVG